MAGPRQRRLVAGAAAFVLALAGGLAHGQEAPRFDVPVACPVGVGCVVRNFVDHDPGGDAADWRCGRLTYDGHKGTDILVPDGSFVAGGVEVLAAAPGTVLRLRDDMDDVSIRVTGADAIKDRMAGNGLVVDHGSGWETQYSHLRKSSIDVRPGDRVAAGQPIGLIGLSGNTEFLHLHFEIRRNGVPVDPYTGTPIGTRCHGSRAPLWTAAALAALGYREDAVIDAGFAAERADPWVARAGGYAALALSTSSPALVFWIDVLGRRAEDRQSMRLIGPDGGVLAEVNDTADETRVQWFQFVGKKRPGSGWAPGTYRGEYTLTRVVAGQPKIVLNVERKIQLR